MDTSKDIRMLVLNILKEGRINVEEADKIINYINSTENTKDKSSSFQYPNPEVITDFAREGVSKIERFVSGLGFNIERVAQNINQRINTKFEHDKNITHSGEKYSFTSEEHINLETHINKIIIDNTWGSIKVTGEERNDISLHIEKIIWTATKESAIERDKGIKVGNIQNNGVLQVLLPTNHQDINDTINLELKVPKYLELQLTTVIGNVNIADMINNKAKIYIKTNSGDIELTNVHTFEIEALSVSGDILLKDIDSIIFNRSTSGDIEINGTVNGQSRLNTISGNVRGFVSINDSFELTSSSGNIDLKTSKNDNCKLLDLVTNSGDIHYHGIVNNTLRTRTNSGQIKAESIVGNLGVIEATSTSGDIEWIIDQDCDVSFTCQTKSGDIFTNMHDVVKSQGKLTGILKEGKAKLLLSSISGDIEFHHDENR